MVLERFLLKFMVFITVASYINQGSRAERIETDLFLTQGPLSARVKDYFDTSCTKRTIELLALGVKLIEIDDTCDTPDRLMGLVYLDSTLRYYHRVAVLQEAEGGFTVVENTGTAEKPEWTRTVYELNSNSPKVKSKWSTSDKVCKELKTFPSMLVLSSSGDVGSFKPAGEDWTIFNPWEPLGFVSREYKLESKCFRLVVVTSYGRVVYGVKLTCGAIVDVNVIRSYEQHRLYLANSVSVKYNKELTVLINHNNLYCTEEEISFEKEGGAKIIVSKKTIIAASSKGDCQNLINGDGGGFEVSKDNVNQLRAKTPKDQFGKLLKSYERSGLLSEYNLRVDLGIMVEKYTKTEGEAKEAIIVTMVVKGLPIIPVRVEPGTPMQIVVRDTEVYYGKTVAFSKSAFRGPNQQLKVLRILGNSYCQCNKYIVNDGRVANLDKEIDAPSTGKEDLCFDFTGCLELVTGNYLKTVESLRYVDLTNEMGVPKSLLTVKDETTPMPH